MRCLRLLRPLTFACEGIDEPRSFKHWSFGWFGRCLTLRVDLLHGFQRRVQFTEFCCNLAIIESKAATLHYQLKC